MELSSMKDLDTVPGDSFFHDFNVLLRDILKEHSAEQSRLLEAAFERHQQFASAKFHALERLCSALAMPTLQEVGQLHSCPDEPCQVGISDCDLEQQSVSGSVDGGVLVQSPTSTDHDNRTSIPRSQSTKLGASNYCQNYSSDMPSVVTEKVHAVAERYSGLAVRRLKCDLLLKFVTGDWFTSVIALLIVINSVVICVNTDYELRVAMKKYNDSGTSDQTIADFFWITDLCFTMIFTVELTLRLIAFECTFFTVTDHQWNLLDTVIVVISLIETIFVGVGLELSYIRVLRLFRIFRTLRVVRTVHFFVKLRTMINAVANSILSLIWALTLIVFTMVMFSAVLLQGATTYILDNVGSTDPVVQSNVEYLEEFFYSLPMAVLTLFMAITSGVSWWDTERVFLDVGFQYGLLFLLYISVMFLALLNIVTGIFVNDAVEMSQMDRDIVMRFEEDRRKQYAHCLRDFFRELDANDNGIVTFDEFKAHLVANGPGIFSYLGLEVWDAVNIFEALDLDGSRQLDIREFMDGCMQLRGGARTFDMVTLMRENKGIMDEVSRTSHQTLAHLEGLERSVKAVVPALTRTALQIEAGRASSFASTLDQVSPVTQLLESGGPTFEI